MVRQHQRPGGRPRPAARRRGRTAPCKWAPAQPRRSVRHPTRAGTKSAGSSSGRPEAGTTARVEAGATTAAGVDATEAGAVVVAWVATGDATVAGGGAVAWAVVEAVAWAWAGVEAVA